MKNCYIDNTTWTIIDLVPGEEMGFKNGMIITRVNTKDEFRGQGAASRLLDQVIEDADREQIPLYLEILSSGRLSYRELEAWYIRKGFKNIQASGVYRRLPKSVKS